MTRPEQSIETVRALIDAYGASPEAWPEEVREAAQAILLAHPDVFADSLADARALDALLERIELPEPAADLAERILAAAPQPPRLQAAPNLLVWLLPRNVRWPTGSALASLAMGIVGGYAFAAAGPTSYDSASDAYAAAFGFHSDLSWLDEETAT